MMEYFLVTLVLFFLLLAYFRVAHKYNIVDQPNYRSAHTEVTLRGGGVIYPLAFILYIITLLIKNENIKAVGLWPFAIGFLLICFISFADDIMNVSKKMRLLFQFVSVAFLFSFYRETLLILPFWALPLIIILAVGFLNAYNFMDGINGMSGLYSLFTLGTFFYINEKIIHFVDSNFIIYPALASLIFLFFNFRKKAKCFMGDVGSIGIAFWILALLGNLMIKTMDLKWILLLSVYGIEVIFTIIERIALKEDIFQAHRRHLYQLLINKAKLSHLVVSAIYAFVQLLINIFVLTSDFPFWINFIVTIIPLSIIYLSIKSYLKKQAIPDSRS